MHLPEGTVYVSGIILLELIGWWLIHSFLGEDGESGHTYIRYLARRASKIFLVIVGVFLILDILGVLGGIWSLFLAMTSVIAFTLFSFGSEISHVIAFLVLVVEDPFSKGDIIEIQDYEGEMRSITPFYVRLKSNGKSVYIPNNIFINESFEVNPEDKEEGEKRPSLGSTYYEESDSIF